MACVKTGRTDFTMSSSKTEYKVGDWVRVKGPGLTDLTRSIYWVTEMSQMKGKTYTIDEVGTGRYEGTYGITCPPETLGSRNVSKKICWYFWPDWLVPAPKPVPKLTFNLFEEDI